MQVDSPPKNTKSKGGRNNSFLHQESSFQYPLKGAQFTSSLTLIISKSQIQFSSKTKHHNHTLKNPNKHKPKHPGRNQTRSHKFQKFSTSLDFWSESSLTLLPCYLRLNMPAVVPLPQDVLEMVSWDQYLILPASEYPCHVISHCLLRNWLLC